MKIAGLFREVGDIVGDIVASIASAIAEQSAVTHDVAGNIAPATAGVTEANHRVAQTATVTWAVARDISGVSAAGQAMSLGSRQVQTSAAELSHLAEQLRTIVAQFKL